MFEINNIIYQKAHNVTKHLKLSFWLNHRRHIYQNKVRINHDSTTCFHKKEDGYLIKRKYKVLL